VSGVDARSLGALPPLAVLFGERSVSTLRYVMWSFGCWALQPRMDTDRCSTGKL